MEIETIGSTDAESAENVVDAPVSTDETTEAPEEPDSVVNTTGLPDMYSNDQFGMYAVEEDWIKKVCGLAVERNGRLYTLTGQVNASILDRYKSIGYVGAIRDELNLSILFVSDQEKMDSSLSQYKACLITAGDFDIIEVNRDEEVRYYANTPADVVSIQDAEFIGYTVQAIVHSDNNLFSPILDQTITGGQFRRSSNAALKDMNDNPVADVRMLNYGDVYKYEWYVGMDYNVMTLIADSKAFIVLNDSPERIHNLPLQMTKEGYEVTDFSSLAPGYYIASGMNAAIFKVN